MSGTKLRIGRETRIEVFTRAGVWIAPATLLREIAKCGFESRKGDITLRASGAVRRDGDRVELRIDQPSGDPLVLQLDGLPESAPERVEVTGRWSEGKLTVSAWKPM